MQDPTSKQEVKIKKIQALQKEVDKCHLEIEALRDEQADIRNDEWISQEYKQTQIKEITNQIRGISGKIGLLGSQITKELDY